MYGQNAHLDSATSCHLSLNARRSLRQGNDSVYLRNTSPEEVHQLQFLADAGATTVGSAARQLEGMMVRGGAARETSTRKDNGV